MSLSIEKQPWFNDVLANLKSRKLRDLAREHRVPVAELQQALERTGHIATRPSTPAPAPTPAAKPPPARAAAPAAPAAESGAGKAHERISALRPLLGKLPDGEIARRAGVARKTVVEFRKRHGIERYRGAGEEAAEAEAEAAAPVAAPVTAPVAAPAPAAEPAASARPEPKSTGRASRLDAFLDIVGVLPDREVGVRSGMTTENVRMYRVRRDIPARWRGEGGGVVAAPAVAAPVAAPLVAPPPVAAAPAPAPEAAAPVAKPRRGRPPGATTGGTKVDRALAPYLDQIGKVADVDVAQLAGVSRSAVSAYRQRHNIAASGRPARGEAPTPEVVAVEAVAPPVAAPVEAPVEAPVSVAPVEEVAVAAPAVEPPVAAPSVAVAASSAWRVVATKDGEDRVFGLVAAGPVEAAMRAHEALSARGWVITRMKLVGEGIPS